MWALLKAAKVKDKKKQKNNKNKQKKKKNHYMQNYPFKYQLTAQACKSSYKPSSSQLQLDNLPG